MKPRTIVRVAVASVWLYQGAWKKVLRRDERHRAIVAAVPGVPAAAAPLLTSGLGAFETAVAAWVLIGRRPLLAAAAQTGLVAAMNAGGLLFARPAIARPGRLMARNAAFVAAAWVAA